MPDTEPRRRTFQLWATIITVLITLSLAGAIAYFFGYLRPPGEVAPQRQAMQTPEKSHESKSAVALEHESAQSKTGKERKVMYWRSPMNPMEIYDNPGKDKMGMDLMPVYEDQMSEGLEVTVDPATQQSMGIRTAKVEKAPLVYTIRTYGHITYDETVTAEISPKFSGWIEKLYINFTGQFVKINDPLFDIYSPDLVTAEEEYLVAYRNLRGFAEKGGTDLLAAARRRLQNWDVPEDQIRTIEETGQIQKTLKIRSPFDGVVVHKSAVEGVFVKEGTTIYKIADLSRVWVDVHIFEYELPWIQVGQEASMTLSYLPGKVYRGKVAYIYPYLQRKTRDVVVRLEFENPELELKPDMYSDVVIKPTLKGEGLIIPSMAVIRTGVRNIVFIARGDGKFLPREVTLGILVEGGKIQILQGLTEGETVVTSGQFLLDSESNLREAVQKMLELKKGASNKDGGGPAVPKE